jgi:hypothetical protein
VDNIDEHPSRASRNSNLPSRLRSALTRHRLSLFAAAVASPIVYLVFVTHFWVNEPDADDWNTLWLVSKSISGHLTLGMLWAQHNEDRMFVPNLVFVAAGRASQGNEETVIALSAAVFIATYFAFLGLCRTYLGRLTWPVVLVVGVVWFGFVDYGNALLAFQLAWYLVLGLFVGMLWLLIGNWAYRVPAAMALAVLASFCSVQGLLLWPVGLLCLRWTKVRSAPWIAAAIATTAVYFIGYSSKLTNAGNLFPANLLGAQSIGGISWRYPLVHLGTTIELSVAELGVPFPAFRQLAGVIILLAAAYVVVRGIQRRELFPIALIAFAALFDALVLLGRLHFGYEGVTASRYSMPGLVMLLGIIVYAWKHVKAKQTAIICLAAIAVQVAVSSVYGISQAGQLRSKMLTAQQLATADPPPPAERPCYDFAKLYFYYVPNLPASFVTTLREQRLSVFTHEPGVSPPIPQCRERSGGVSSSSKQPG